MKTKRQAEDEANVLQVEKNKVYRNIETGRQVLVKMINVQEFCDDYVVQISAEELDTNKPIPTRVTETADIFFKNYVPN